MPIPLAKWPQALALAAASLGSHYGFTWESPSPAQVATNTDCFIALAGWPQAKTRVGADLIIITFKTQN